MSKRIRISNNGSGVTIEHRELLDSVPARGENGVPFDANQDIWRTATYFNNAAVVAPWLGRIAHSFEFAKFEKLEYQFINTATVNSGTVLFNTELDLDDMTEGPNIDHLRRDEHTFEGNINKTQRYNVPLQGRKKHLVKHKADIQQAINTRTWMGRCPSTTTIAWVDVAAVTDLSNARTLGQLWVAYTVHLWNAQETDFSLGKVIYLNPSQSPWPVMNQRQLEAILNSYIDNAVFQAAAQAQLQAAANGAVAGAPAPAAEGAGPMNVVMLQTDAATIDNSSNIRSGKGTQAATFPADTVFPSIEIKGAAKAIPNMVNMGRLLATGHVHMTETQTAAGHKTNTTYRHEFPNAKPRLLAIPGNEETPGNNGTQPTPLDQMLVNHNGSAGDLITPQQFNDRLTANARSEVLNRLKDIVLPINVIPPGNTTIKLIISLDKGTWAAQPDNTYTTPSVYDPHGYGITLQPWKGTDGTSPVDPVEAAWKAAITAKTYSDEGARQFGGQGAWLFNVPDHITARVSNMATYGKQHEMHMTVSNNSDQAWTYNQANSSQNSVKDMINWAKENAGPGILQLLKLLPMAGFFIPRYLQPVAAIANAVASAALMTHSETIAPHEHLPDINAGYLTAPFLTHIGNTSITTGGGGGGPPTLQDFEWSTNTALTGGPQSHCQYGPSGTYGTAGDIACKPLTDQNPGDGHYNGSLPYFGNTWGGHWHGCQFGAGSYTGADPGGPKGSTAFLGAPGTGHWPNCEAIPPDKLTQLQSFVLIDTVNIPSLPNGLQSNNDGGGAANPSDYMGVDFGGSPNYKTLGYTQGSTSLTTRLTPTNYGSWTVPGVGTVTGDKIEIPMSQNNPTTSGNILNVVNSTGGGNHMWVDKQTFNGKIIKGYRLYAKGYYTQAGADMTVVPFTIQSMANCNQQNNYTFHQKQEGAPNGWWYSVTEIIIIAPTASASWRFVPQPLAPLPTVNTATTYFEFVPVYFETNAQPQYYELSTGDANGDHIGQAVIADDVTMTHAGPLALGANDATDHGGSMVTTSTLGNHNNWGGHYPSCVWVAPGLGVSYTGIDPGGAYNPLTGHWPNCQPLATLPPDGHWIATDYSNGQYRPVTNTYEDTDIFGLQDQSPFVYNRPHTGGGSNPVNSPHSTVQGHITERYLRWNATTPNETNTFLDNEGVTLAYDDNVTTTVYFRHVRRGGVVASGYRLAFETKNTGSGDPVYAVVGATNCTTAITQAADFPMKQVTINVFPNSISTPDQMMSFTITKSTPRVTNRLNWLTIGVLQWEADPLYVPPPAPSSGPRAKYTIEFDQVRKCDAGYNFGNFAANEAYRSWLRINNSQSNILQLSANTAQPAYVRTGTLTANGIANITYTGSAALGADTRFGMGGRWPLTETGDILCFYYDPSNDAETTWTAKVTFKSLDGVAVDGTYAYGFVHVARLGSTTNDFNNVKWPRGSLGHWGDQMSDSATFSGPQSFTVAMIPHTGAGPNGNVTPVLSNSARLEIEIIPGEAGDIATTFST